MDSEQPRKTSTAFELFLYAAIIAETGLAALIYKVLFRSPDMERMRIYFAIFYFAFLAWAIAQLNILHRDRTASVEPTSPATPLPHQERERIEDAVAGEDEHAATPGPTRPLLGLSGPQLVIVVVVFATAVVTFSWALRLLE